MEEPRHRPDEDAVREELREESDRVEGAESPEDDPVTSRDESGEPSGEDEAGNEAEIE